MTDDWPSDALDVLTDGDIYLGRGPVQEDAHVIRALCRDSLSARRLLEESRTLLYASASLVPPHLERHFSGVSSSTMKRPDRSSPRKTH